MKDRKRRLETFSFYDQRGICNHLERMAAKGWMIERLSNFGWVYRRVQPKRVTFAVSYYPKASEFDPEPTEGQKTLFAFCAHTGWQLACSSAQLQIFYNEQEHPTPIETEPTLEVESIHASVKRSFLPAYGVLLFLGLLQEALFLSGLLGDPIDKLSSPLGMFAGVCWGVVILLCLVELVCYFHWHRRAKKAAQRGEFLAPISTAKFQKAALVVVGLELLYLVANVALSGDSMLRWVGGLMILYLAALLFLINGVKQLLKRKKASRGVNRTLTWIASFVLSFAMMGGIVFVTLRLSSMGFFAAEDQGAETTWMAAQDQLPLTLEDLLEVNPEDYIRERRGDGSLLLGQHVMREYARLDGADTSNSPWLEYTIVQVKLPALYDLCKDRLLSEKETGYPTGEKEYRPQDATPWGAREVYRLYDPVYGSEQEYLLCYDNLLVELSISWEPTEEQMQMMGARLGLSSG